MKWIGQHIYDLVSRFRDDVYLEDISTTTETNVLVVVRWLIYILKRNLLENSTY